MLFAITIVTFGIVGPWPVTLDTIREIRNALLMFSSRCNIGFVVTHQTMHAILDTGMRVALVLEALRDGVKEVIIIWRRQFPLLAAAPGERLENPDLVTGSPYTSDSLGLGHPRLSCSVLALLL
jgi:hypothetical protein